MSTLILKFKNVMLNFQNNPLPVIEGYILSKDNKQNKTLILERVKEKVWKTKWVNNSQYIVKEPAQPINNIFS